MIGETNINAIKIHIWNSNKRKRYILSAGWIKCAHLWNFPSIYCSFRSCFSWYWILIRFDLCNTSSKTFQTFSCCFSMFLNRSFFPVKNHLTNRKALNHSLDWSEISSSTMHYRLQPLPIVHLSLLRRNIHRFYRPYPTSLWPSGSLAWRRPWQTGPT